MDKSIPRNAATVAVVRDGPTGLETLLLQHAGSALVVAPRRGFLRRPDPATQENTP